MTHLQERNKAVIAPLRAAAYDWTETRVRAALRDIMKPDAIVHMCHPFGDVSGPDAFYDQVLDPLATAWPDVERRDWIVMSGTDDDGHDWVGCGGTYIGQFLRPFLDIPPTGHVAHMRFHEFYRIADGKVVEVQAIWDIPEVMMQANAWPMPPALGREWHVPGPAPQNGTNSLGYDTGVSEKSKKHIIDMLTALQRHPVEPVAAMELEKFWHPRMMWYGPAGIGTARGIAGFRNWHQIPFLNAMPDRGQYPQETTLHFFGDGPFVGVTGWPDMMQTITGSGWLGIAPSGQKVSLRSLDFWHIEADLIRENWVLVDLLHVYDQIGVDILGRMREFNKARSVGAINLPFGDLT